MAGDRRRRAGRAVHRAQCACGFSRDRGSRARRAVVSAPNGCRGATRRRVRADRRGRGIGKPAHGTLTAACRLPVGILEGRARRFSSVPYSAPMTQVARWPNQPSGSFTRSAPEQIPDARRPGPAHRLMAWTSNAERRFQWCPCSVGAFTSSKHSISSRAECTPSIPARPTRRAGGRRPPRPRRATVATASFLRTVCRRDAGGRRWTPPMKRGPSLWISPQGGWSRPRRTSRR